MLYVSKMVVVFAVLTVAFSETSGKTVYLTKIQILWCISIEEKFKEFLFGNNAYRSTLRAP